MEEDDQVCGSRSGVGGGDCNAGVITDVFKLCNLRGSFNVDQLLEESLDPFDDGVFDEGFDFRGRFGDVCEVKFYVDVPPLLEQLSLTFNRRYLTHTVYLGRRRRSADSVVDALMGCSQLPQNRHPKPTQ